MKATIAILFYIAAATAALAEGAEHRLSGGECVEMAHVYYRAATDRDKGSTLEYVMDELEQARNSSHDEPDTYIYDLVKIGVAYVFKTPNLTPDQEGRKFLDFCYKHKGSVDSGSSYFKGEQL